MQDNGGCVYDSNQMRMILKATLKLPFPYQYGEFIQRLSCYLLLKGLNKMLTQSH